MRRNNKLFPCNSLTVGRLVFYFSVFAGKKELLLANIARTLFPATTLQISAPWPTGARELSGFDPWAGPFCQTSSENSYVPFISELTGRTGQIGQTGSDRSVTNNYHQYMSNFMQSTLLLEVEVV